ncbi:type II toxin-antitoxin system HipA family toxin YjjJ [Xylophilus sp.]|uniref:type II toxin-antitoxin system HipA family toxin YjjJ n=1 Tax=Xylophilus sp. TaxID=2653893 RepID=UPI002D7F5CC7|nr:type II toxin-antitoxin system HipA family toxin YjjJ [Xylophilus sp.]
MAGDPAVAEARLTMALARQAPAAAADLARTLGVSVPTLHRWLQALPPGRLVAAGRARRARYALRRPVRGLAEDLPVYRVDADGRAELLAPLAALHPQGSLLDLGAGGHWPVPEDARDGWWPGLPYPLYDMRPQGYMGRLFARAEHAALGVPADPREWGDDEILHVLAQRGEDASGNLIVGDAAYRRWLAQRAAPPVPLEPEATAEAYAALAQQAVATGVPGSSAAGEFPKFAALRAPPPGSASATPHVLVKFSGAGGSAAEQRWSDLLVCEHLALHTLGVMGLLPVVGAAISRILSHGGRTFLEVERFDRHGDGGRSALCTLETVNAAFVGDASQDWSRLAARLAALELLTEDDRAAVERLWWFGRLIGNTDMHAGNLSFRPADGRLALAPAYDMLPMLHAPLAGGEVPQRAFEPPRPLPPQRAVWHAAYAAALRFWEAAAGDARIGDGFRGLCAAHREALRQAACVA